MHACNAYAGRTKDKAWADQLHQALVIVKGKLDKQDSEQKGKGGDTNTQRDASSASKHATNADSQNSGERDIASLETTVSCANRENMWYRVTTFFASRTRLACSCICCTFFLATTLDIHASCILPCLQLNTCRDICTMQYLLANTSCFAC
jgi:hypothetical protein